MVSTTAELKERFLELAHASDLQVECAMHGTFQAQLAVIGEAPGSNEVAQGIPLVGGAGHILWRALRTYVPHIKRHECYVTNVCKRQVAFGTDDKRRPIGKHELTGWQELLRWELEQLPNLKYILCLGAYALDALCEKKGINNWRGSVLNTKIGERDVHVVVCNNPAYAAREPIQQIIFDMDINDKLKPVVDNQWKPHDVLTHINPSVRDALEWIKVMKASRDPVATDIESLGNETACVGLASSPTEAMCIAFRQVDYNVYSPEDESRILHALYDLFNAPQTRVVWQNGGFDGGWLWFKDRIRVKPAYVDTMLGHHVLYPTLPHDLGFIVKQYTNHPYYKGEKDSWREVGSIDDYWRYNGKDCALTYASALKIVHELKEQNLYKFFVEHVMRLQSHLIRMTVGGVKVDLDLRDKIASDVARAVDDKLSEFYKSVIEATGDSAYLPNPSSPKQMSELWFTRLKLVGRGTSTDKENRDLMFKHPRTSELARVVIQRTNEYIEDKKFFSTYAEAQPDEDGRMRCDYKQTGVRNAPGRLSSAGTLWGSGMNLQNIPDRAKDMFIADEGYCFIYIDGSQAEARVVGWRYNILHWIEQFERARLDGIYDAHRALASEMFRIPYDEVPTFDRYPLSPADAEIMGVPFQADVAGKVTKRYIAKRCRHGLNYRMGPDRLALTTGLSLSDASEAYTLYHRINPEIKKGWQRDYDEVKRNKSLYNALGRRYLQLEPATLETTDSIVAFYPQSTIGDMVCRVIYKSHDDPMWPKADARIALNTHDGLIGIAKIGEPAKQALRVMIKHAEEPLVINGRKLIIPAEPAMSVPDEHGVHRWSTIKKLKGDKLKELRA